MTRLLKAADGKQVAPSDPLIGGLVGRGYIEVSPRRQSVSLREPYTAIVGAVQRALFVVNTKRWDGQSEDSRSYYIAGDSAVEVAPAANGARRDGYGGSDAAAARSTGDEADENVLKLIPRDAFFERSLDFLGLLNRLSDWELSPELPELPNDPASPAAGSPSDDTRAAWGGRGIVNAGAPGGSWQCLWGHSDGSIEGGEAEWAEGKDGRLWVIEPVHGAEDGETGDGSNMSGRVTSAIGLIAELASYLPATAPAPASEPTSK